MKNESIPITLEELEQLAAASNSLQGNKIAYDHFMEPYAPPDIRLKIEKQLSRQNLNLFHLLKDYQDPKQSNLVKIEFLKKELMALGIKLESDDLHTLFKHITLDNKKRFNLTHLAKYIHENERPDDDLSSHRITQREQQG